MNRSRPRQTSSRKSWERNKNQRRKLNQRKRASWLEFWHSVSHRSNAATDKHLNKRSNRSQSSRNVATGEHRHYSQALPGPTTGVYGVFRDWMNWIAGTVFFLLSYLVGSALFFKFKNEAQTGFFLEPTMLCFFGGVAVWAILFYTRILERLFLFLYVFGHEFTHAFFVWVFLGRISDIAITSEGGYVQTKRTNFIIALSPYFVPFIGLFSVGIFLLIRHFVDIPYDHYFLHGLVGFTWAFHILWTADMLGRGQSDLEECGSFMSYGIITFFNILLLSLMVCLATTSWLDLFSFTINAWNQFQNFVTVTLTPSL